MALLEIDRLSKYYGDVRALIDVSCTVKRGEFVVVIGPSGSGKSTLLRCVNRMIEPSSGTILYEDQDVRSLGRKALRKLRSRIGMVFQHYNLVYRLSVIENVLHGRLGHKSLLDGVLGRYTEKEKENAARIIGQLGLEDQAYKRCDELSGGQKQRVGIARALIQRPHLILSDEPIASLDPHAAKRIMDHLRSISSDLGIAILCNLHQVDVARRYADRIIGVNSGLVAFEGKPGDLTKKKVYEIYGTEAGDLISD